AEPIHQWLLNRQDEVHQDRPGRHVGQSDIDALWAMGEAFTDVDRRLGGGYARSTLLHYVNQAALPLLHGSYGEVIGRDLMAATARLCDLCAFMSFDSGRQGLAQRYFVQALRLAQASGNRTLGRAYALGGDRRACAAARLVAERALDRAAPAEEPSWIRFFNSDQLAAEMLYMAGELGRQDDVQRLAPAVLVSSGGMERRRVMCTTTLAASYLPGENNSHSDVDRACELLGEVIPSLGSLHSSRSLERVNSVRRAFTPHARRPSVQEFEDRFRSVVMAVGTPA
ncbi:MAG: hypothetical protein ACRDTF_14445, partial [Pseudonocardiaceae bacterium]